MGSSLSVPPVPTNLTTRDQKRRFIRTAIDLHGFRWLVFEVAASGFFTDSYNLFATNVILPSIAFVYWPDAPYDEQWRETLINCATLGGSLLGQLVFGYLADRYGRTRLYGIELAIVIFSTICVSASSQGFSGSVDIVPWMVCMRLVMGIGIGAEYPLSAAICAEWASTRARAVMMAAVFMMQPLGQIVSQIVGLAVLEGYNNRKNIEGCYYRETRVISGVTVEGCGPEIDGIWRWVTGVGAIPAVVAIYYRFQLRDPGLYDLDVKNEGDRAVKNTVNVYRRVPISLAPDGTEMQEANGHGDSNCLGIHEPPLPKQFSKADLQEYFWHQGNWRYVAGTSVCWFMLDVYVPALLPRWGTDPVIVWLTWGSAFYGLGMGSPRTIAKLWTYVAPSLKEADEDEWKLSKPIPALDNATVPVWNSKPQSYDRSIYWTLRENSIENITTVGISSLFGSILLIFIINYIPRKQFLMYSFLWLAALFFITGASIFQVHHTEMHAVSIVLIALCHFSFNLGPNTLTFIIPAEIFPTRYRCTCHGIAAAAGKLGSVIVQALLPALYKFENHDRKKLGWTFIGFGFVMAAGWLFAWAWLPALQNPRDVHNGLRLPSKTLEQLGEGIQSARDAGETIGMRDCLDKAIKPCTRRARTTDGESVGS